MKTLVRPAGALMALLVSMLVIPGAYSQRNFRIIERHPTPDNIPEVTDPKFILREEPASTFLNEYEYETITIGVAEGEHHEMFGKVADIASMGNDTFLVLDSEYGELRLYNYDGSLLGTFGQLGEGPGEFPDSPDHISIADQGKSVFTVGSGSHFIIAFEREDVSTFTPKLRFVKDLIGSTGCAMNGHFWFLGYTPSVKGVLHKYNYEGQRVASFLDYYKSPREYISHRLSKMGSIACSEKHGIVALNRVNAPVITGYTEDGEVVWQIKLADFAPLQFIELSPPGWGGDIPKPGKALIWSLFTDSAGDFYVYYHVIEGDGHLFKIEAQTGKGTYLGKSPQAQVWDIDSEFVFSASNSPFPHVVIHRPKKAGSN